MAQAAAAAVSFSGEDKQRLSRLARECDARLLRLDGQYGVQGHRAVVIPWVFAKTRGPTYEGGLPHTRSNIIFLEERFINSTSDCHLARILAHEKVHVYQRLFGSNVADWAEQQGYRRLNMRTSPGNELLRANPDLDEWVYADRAGRTMGMWYRSAAPAGVQDVWGSGVRFEHPYETAAYGAAEELFPLC